MKVRYLHLEVTKQEVEMITKAVGEMGGSLLATVLMAPRKRDE